VDNKNDQDVRLYPDYATVFRLTIIMCDNADFQQEDTGVCANTVCGLGKYDKNLISNYCSGSNQLLRQAVEEICFVSGTGRLKGSGKRR
jgi:hypothetical protein